MKPTFKLAVARLALLPLVALSSGCEEFSTNYKQGQVQVEVTRSNSQAEPDPQLNMEQSELSSLRSLKGQLDRALRSAEESHSNPSAIRRSEASMHSDEARRLRSEFRSLLNRVKSDRARTEGRDMLQEIDESIRTVNQ